LPLHDIYEEPPGRPALSRDRIVRTALRIVDTEGLGALSMRRLGSELGVVPMATYHHFPNKSALYDGIVEAVMGEIDTSADDPGAPFAARLKHAARAYRDVLVAHPNAMPVLMSNGPKTPQALVPVETMLRIFRDAGLSAAQAMAGVDVVASMVQGAASMRVNQLLADADAGCPPAGYYDVLAEALPAERFPVLREALAGGELLDIDAEFEFGLDVIVRGFEQRIAERAGTPLPES
jgi:TetR/AcrR family tetracycline transcriptional repressor